MSLAAWDSYFNEMDSLLVTAERQYGVASASFTDYTIERFELAIQSTGNIIGCLENVTRMISSEQSIYQGYKQDLDQLLSQLRFLLDQWKNYKMLLDSNSNDCAYQTPLLYSGRRGRPKFDIEKEQLEYLVSLSFSWNEIASLLCVSRMTLYRYM